MTIIATVNTADVTDALVAWLGSWAQLVDADATIEDSEPVNDSPERCPWVGVYRTRVALVPRTLGMGAGYRTQEISLALVLTAASSDSGVDCKRRLETLVQAVTSALCSNESISATVDAMTDMSVTYSDYSRVGASFFQQAVVALTATARVSAS